MDNVTEMLIAVQYEAKDFIYPTTATLFKMNAICEQWALNLKRIDLSAHLKTHVSDVQLSLNYHYGILQYGIECFR